MENKVDISVIVPSYNEGEEVSHFLDDLISNLDALGRSYEILFLDNNTKGNSQKVLKEYSQKHPNFKAFVLEHPGVAVVDKSNKYMFGFQKAKGEIIIHLDADGQDRPEELPRFIEKLEKGYDMVVGRKMNRKDSFLYKFPSAVLNFIIRFLTGVTVHDMNNGFKAYKRKVARSLNLYAGNFRYIPIILNSAGYKVTEIPVKHLERRFGSGKFNFISRAKGGIFDLISILLVTKGGRTPVYFYSKLAIFKSLFGVLLFIIAIFYIESLPLALILFFLGILAFMAAFILFLFGVALENVRAVTAKNHLEPLVVKKY